MNWKCLNFRSFQLSGTICISYIEVKISVDLRHKLKHSSIFLSKTSEYTINCLLAYHKKDMWISSEKNCVLCSRCAKILVELISLMCSKLPLCCIFSCPTKSVKGHSSLFRYLQCKRYRSGNYKGNLVHLAVKLILLITWALFQVHV